MALNGSAIADLGFERLFRPMNDLAPADRPYALARPTRYRLRGAADPDGVPRFVWEGTATYHPVQIAQQALSDLENHRLTGKERFLARARHEVGRLLREAVTSRSALYFPYRFDFPLGGDRTDMMTAPWFSAMAQGQVLSALVRMLEVTGDDSLMDPIDKTFQSFLNAPAAGLPWTVFVDEGGYLWFEEYAKDPPMRVLNGHIFAMFGLYDYHRLTDDQLAATLFDGGAATVARYGPKFRDPGALSRYCLRVTGIRSEKYHLIHQQQLRAVGAITGDAQFEELAAQLAADFVVRPPSTVHRVVRRLRRTARNARRFLVHSRR